MSKKDRSIVIIFILFILLICGIIAMGFFTKDNVERFTIRKKDMVCTYENRIIELESLIEENINDLVSDNNIVTKSTENVQISKVENEKSELKVVSNNEKKETIKIKKEEPKTFKTDVKKEVDSKSVSVVDSKKGENTNSVIEIQKQEDSSKKQEGILSTYKGYSTMAKIEIPKTGLNTYIYDSMSVAKMKIAPCYSYSTGKLNISGKTLILGHNHNDGKIFSNNFKLQNGDKIYVTTLDEKRVEYIVYKKFTTTPEDVSFLNNAVTPEIILSCCTDDDNKRLLILAKASK